MDLVLGKPGRCWRDNPSQMRSVKERRNWVDSVILNSATPNANGKLGARPRRQYLRSVPIFYECQRCTACCRWPGQVQLSDEEIARLASFKGLTEFDFIQQFTRLTKDRRGLAVQEKPDGECIFLDGNDCSVQAVKPRQCREFPNLWNFPGFEKVCHAIPRMVSSEEYERRVASVTAPTA